MFSSTLATRLQREGGFFTRISIHELPVPKPGSNEVLIALYASGVGVWDAEIRQGWWPEDEPKFPLVLGTDGAGIVAGTGVNVSCAIVRRHCCNSRGALIRTRRRTRLDAPHEGRGNNEGGRKW
jgi:NADPH:quinone reductase-like Zn-dependent oxidoreductase